MDLLERASKNKKAESKPKREPKKAEWDVPEVKTPLKKKEVIDITPKNNINSDTASSKMTFFKGENFNKKETSAIVKFDNISNEYHPITKQEVMAHKEMYDFVKASIVDDSDFASIKGKKFLKKSGVRKFINAFGISIELVEKKVFELLGDTHAEVRVRAITQKGQSVEGLGLKSMKELHDPSLHNLVTTAWTRAVNRAILDLVAFGEVSAEEMNDEKVDW